MPSPAGWLVLWVCPGTFSASHSLELESLALVTLSWVRWQPLPHCPWEVKLIGTTAEVLGISGSQAGGVPGGGQPWSAWRPVDPTGCLGHCQAARLASLTHLRVLSSEVFPGRYDS